MYLILSDETTDVDIKQFDQVGRFDIDVSAVPYINVQCAIKGVKGNPADTLVDCQNSVYISFEAPFEDRYIDDLLERKAFKPGILYRRQGIDYAELKYECPLGDLRIFAFFLVAATDCAFGYTNEGEAHFRVDLAELWRVNMVRRANG